MALNRAAQRPELDAVDLLSAMVHYLKVCEQYTGDKHALPSPSPVSDEVLQQLEACLERSIQSAYSSEADLVEATARALQEEWAQMTAAEAQQFTDPKCLLASAHDGDVVLLRASWLLARAGIVQLGASLDAALRLAHAAAAGWVCSAAATG